MAASAREKGFMPAVLGLTTEGVALDELWEKADRVVFGIFDVVAEVFLPFWGGGLAANAGVGGARDRRSMGAGKGKGSTPGLLGGGRKSGNECRLRCRPGGIGRGFLKAIAS